MSLYAGYDIVKALVRLGFEEISQRGSHAKLKHPDGRVVIVPMHREVKRGTFSSVLRQARVTEAELVAKM